MKNTVTSSPRLEYSDVTISNNKITNPDSSLVWYISESATSGYWTIYNQAVDKHVVATGLSGRADLTNISDLSSADKDYALWSITASSTSYGIANKKRTSQIYLRKNGTYGFATYTDGTVDIYKLIVPVSSVSLNQSTLTFESSNSAPQTLTATVLPANASDKSVSWSSSDTNVATVSNGVVTPVGAGSATITVTTTDGSKTATCNVQVLL